MARQSPQFTNNPDIQNTHAAGLKSSVFIVKPVKLWCFVFLNEMGIGVVLEVELYTKSYLDFGQRS